MPDMKTVVLGDKAVQVADTDVALIEQYKVGMFDGSYIKGAVWGTYPQTMDMQGGNVVSILSIPQNNEGLGYALRNIQANHAVMMTHRNAMQGAALAQIRAVDRTNGRGFWHFHRACDSAMPYWAANAKSLPHRSRPHPNPTACGRA